MSCVEFPQVQYINLSEILYVLKAVAIVAEFSLMKILTSRTRTFVTFCKR